MDLENLLKSLAISANSNNMLWIIGTSRLAPGKCECRVFSKKSGDKVLSRKLGEFVIIRHADTFTGAVQMVLDEFGKRMEQKV